ncbi:MAG: SRPBCC domain-containing protein [Thermoanaerobaculia bacterium]
MPSQAADTTLTLHQVFAAKPERVFKAWTRAEELKRWSAPGDYTVPHAEVDLRVGGGFVIHMQAPNGTLHRVGGEYSEIDPPRRLVYSWRWESQPESPVTRVSVEFRAHPEGTEVVLVHDLFLDEEQRDRHRMGWQGCLDNLAKFLG